MVDSSSKRPVGLIGVGLLGAAIYQRLEQRGFSVRAFDLEPDRVRVLGGETVTPAEIARQCDVCVLCLPTSQVVAQVIAELGPVLRPGQVLADTTTGTPAESEENGRVCAAAKAGYLEANVAGSSTQLLQGEAALFLGGSESDLERSRPVLEALSGQRFHLGPVGAASRFKLVHNLVLGLHRAALAEGLAFAETLGFDLPTTLDVLRQTPAASEVMKTKGRKMVEGDWTPQARLTQHHKDVRLIIELARQTQAAVPLSQSHQQLLARAEQLGFGELDNSSILEVLRELRLGSDQAT